MYRCACARVCVGVWMYGPACVHVCEYKNVSKYILKYFTFKCINVTYSKKQLLLFT